MKYRTTNTGIHPRRYNIDYDRHKVSKVDVEEHRELLKYIDQWLTRYKRKKN